jgi:hypothetical protein
MKSCNGIKKDGLWLFVAIVVFLINQLPFLVDMRSVMYDEAWYGDTAYNLTQGKGFLNAIVGRGGNANFLLPLLTSVFMMLFGYNLFAIRVVAVFCGVLTLVFLALSMRQMHVGWKAKSLVLLFFVASPFFNTVFRFGRPECLALMCVMGGLWFYLRYLEDESWQNILGISLFAFASGCAHPFGLFLFALIGLVLLIQAVAGKKAKMVGHLMLLLVIAVACVGLIMKVSSIYNIGDDGHGVMARFSANEALKAVPAYFKEAFFSRAAVYVLPLLFVLAVEAWFDSTYRVFAIIALVHFLAFPICFSTDLMMVGLGLDYVVLAATLLLPPFLERLLAKKRKWMLVAYCAYCIGSLVVSYYYNYVVKFERANSVLAKDLQAIVPEGAKVFGPIRQWPMLMQTNYQSDHTMFPVERAECYDFVVLNSQDENLYMQYKAVLPINELRMELVYEKPTRQYGMVQIYKPRSIKE